MVPPDHLVAKNGPILPKLVLAGPNLATKIGPGIDMVQGTTFGSRKWSPGPIVARKSGTEGGKGLVINKAIILDCIATFGTEFSNLVPDSHPSYCYM